MSSGRTTWYPEDGALHRRELVVELGEEHGGGAVNVYRTLRDNAQEQRDPDGAVLTGYRSLARAAHVTVDECRRFVTAAGELGLLDELVTREDGRRFTCRISGWSADQERGRAAVRKQDQRRRADTHAESAPAVSSERDESRDVTEKPPPNQTKPKKKNPPNPPEGGRERDRAEYEKELEVWAQENGLDRLDFAAVRGAVTILRFRRLEVTAETVADYLDNGAPWLREEEEELRREATA